MKKLIAITVMWIVLYILTVIFVSLLPEEMTGILRKPKANEEYNINAKAVSMISEVPYFLFEDPEVMTTTEIATPSSAIEEPKKAKLLVEDVLMVFIPSGAHLTMQGGTFNGPSGKETYYNLDMSSCIGIMRNMGYSESDYPYWVREDGVKMLGDYVMCAAELSTRPKGTIIETSLGQAIVVDTGSFAYGNPTQIDLCVTW